jgi:hypothetical protein
MPKQKYIMGIISATSQWLNVVFLLGHSNESISGRSHRESWRVKRLINLMFFWQVDHCKSAYINDLKWSKAYIEQDKKDFGSNNS